MSNLDSQDNMLPFKGQTHKVTCLLTLSLRSWWRHVREEARCCTAMAGTRSQKSVHSGLL